MSQAIISQESFKQLYQRAADRKGGKTALEELLNAKGYGNTDLTTLTDDRILSAFTKHIFKSGFIWRVVENKWTDFEEVFFNFNIEKILMMPEEMLERKAADPKIIRNYNKVKTIKANAQMLFDYANEHQAINNINMSFSQFLINWPSNDIIGLWAFLKKNGQRLGGNTGPYALRLLGIDTFILSSDVEAYLRAQNIIDGGIQSKKSLNAIQHYFNQLQKETGYSLQKLSRLIAFANGDNYVQI